jgi:hypothetical protein
MGLFFPRKYSCNIHSFIVRMILIPRFHGRRMNGNKKNLGWIRIVGKFTVVGRFAQRNPESQEDKWKTSYEFMLQLGGGWGGGGEGMFFPSFLPSNQCSVPCRPPKQT